MADETILIEVEYDTGEAEKEIDSLTESIEGQKVALAQLQEQVKSGEKSQVEASKEQAKLGVQLQQEKKQRNDLIKIVKTEQGSRDRLRQTISELIRKRNALNTSTKQGAKESENLRKKINKLDKQLKKTGTETEKNKQNIGNYGDAISNTVPGVGMFIQSFKMMSKVLLANPIGAIVALIVLLGAALKNFFTRSEEGQDKWNKVMTKAKVVLDNFQDGLAKIGKGFIDFNKKLFESEKTVKQWSKEVGTNARKAWNKFRDDVSDQGFWDTVKSRAADTYDTIKGKIQEVVEENKRELEIAGRIADARNNLNKIEREAIVTRAKNAKQIADLVLLTRLESVANDEKVEALAEANRIKREELDLNLLIAKENLRIKKQENALSLSTREDLDEEARLEAEVFRVQKENADQRRELINREVELNNRIRAEKKAAQAEDLAFEQFERELEAESTKEHNEVMLEIEKEHLADLTEATKDAEEAKTEIAQEEAEKRQALIQATLDATAQVAAETFGLLNQLNEDRLDKDLSNLEKQKQQELAIAGNNATARAAIEAKFEKDREKLEKAAAKKRKRLAITEAIIRGALVVLNALTTQPFIPLGLIAAAAAAITTGLQIAKIKNSQFAKGGQVPLAKRGANFGTFQGPSHSAGGVDLFTGSGQHVANVEGKENFYVVNKNASDYINSLSDINQRIGGGVPLSNKSFKMQDGGQANVEAQPQQANINDITKNVIENLPPIIVRTEDIKTGLEDRSDVVNVGVI